MHGFNVPVKKGTGSHPPASKATAAIRGVGTAMLLVASAALPTLTEYWTPTRIASAWET